MRMRKILAVLLTAVLFALPVQAELSISGSSAYYLPGANSYTTYSLSINDQETDVVLTKKSISISNPKVGALYGYMNYEDYQSETDSIRRYANIRFRPLAAGTATITAKVGSQTLSKKITVYNYTNPLKSLVISGIEGGKNLASKFKKTSSVTGAALTKNTTIKKITAKAASGWVITNMQITSNREDDYANHYHSYRNSPTKATLKCAMTLEKGKYHYVYINLVNKSNGGSISLHYSIR